MDSSCEVPVVLEMVEDVDAKDSFDGEFFECFRIVQGPRSPLSSSTFFRIRRDGEGVLYSLTSCLNLDICSVESKDGGAGSGILSFCLFEGSRRGGGGGGGGGGPTEADTGTFQNER